MYFEVTTKRGSHNLIYREALVKENDQDKIILDFDGFENQVAFSDLLRVTDELHHIIKNEYFNIVKEPILAYMRTGRFE